LIPAFYNLNIQKDLGFIFVGIGITDLKKIGVKKVKWNGIEVAWEVAFPLLYISFLSGKSGEITYGRIRKGDQAGNE